MRPKSLLLLALALGCGLIASIGISQVMESNKQGQTGVEKEAIYVAKVTINTGDPINSEMVLLKEWAKGDIPPGAIRELSDVEDRRPRTPVFQGEPILESKLLNPGEKGADPTQHIPKGFRIVPISVRADTGAAGLLRPGDRVDVQWYVPRNPQMGITETVTKTILHNVRVFAVDQAVTRPATGDEAPTLAKTITLLLPPKDANKVQLAVKLGEVSLIPRHPDDPSAEDAFEVTYDDLFEESDKGSRAKEQGRDPSETDSPGLLAGLFDRARATFAAGAATAMVDQGPPPWEMELVNRDQVELLKFDGVTGKPLRDFTQAFSAEGNENVEFPGSINSLGEQDGDHAQRPPSISDLIRNPQGGSPLTERAAEAASELGIEFPIDFEDEAVKPN